MPTIRLNYAPSPGQLAFHKDRYVVPERLLACGSGGGKSYGMLFEALDWTFENPPGTCLYGYPNVPMLKKSLYPAWTELTGAPLGTPGTLGATWNSTDRHLTLPNGWEIWFVTVEDPKRIEGPPSVDLAVLDEARVVRHLAGDDGAWAQMTRRLRGSPQKKRRRGAIMGTHSPTKAIVTLFKPREVKRWRARGPGGALGYYEVADCEEPTRRAYQWSLHDAVAWRTLDEAGAATILRGLTTDAARLRVAEGRYALQTGRVLSEYDPVHHLKDPPRGAKFVRVAGGIDWGYDMTALVVTADTGSRRYTVWEAGLEGASLQEMAEKIRDAERSYGRMRWWGGPDRPDSAKELRELGVNVRPAKPTRVEDGIGIMNAELKQDEWHISPRCKGVLDDAENYVRNERGDPDKQAHDPHFIDAARYERVMAGKGGKFAVG